MFKTHTMIRVILLAAVLNAGAVQAAQLGRSQPQIVDNIRGGRGSNPATGLQLALVAPAQIFSSDYDVYGFRLNLIYGLNQNLRGLDLGIINVGQGLMEGVQFGVVNRVQALAGVQIGLYNSFDETEGGCFQMGIINHAVDFAGLQLGPLNYARHVNGAQIGLVNICETTEGVQIGIINIISQSDFLVFCPIINAQF